MVSRQIDLFAPPVHILHLVACLKARAENPKWGLRRIARELQIGYMTVKRSFTYAAQMQSHGMTEPYRELHEAPAAAAIRSLPNLS